MIYRHKMNATLPQITAKNGYDLGTIWVRFCRGCDKIINNFQYFGVFFAHNALFIIFRNISAQKRRKIQLFGMGIVPQRRRDQGDKILHHGLRRCGVGAGRSKYPCVTFDGDHMVSGADAGTNIVYKYFDFDGAKAVSLTVGGTIKIAEAVRSINCSSWQSVQFPLSFSGART